MEETILISYLNDFIYCPISIYFHKLYGNREKLLYQREKQLDGIRAHKTIEEITKNKGIIFNFIQAYYRWFMKGANIENIPIVELEEK